REGDRVARPGIDGNGLAPDGQVDERVEGVVLEVADDDPLDGAVECLNDVAQQVVRQGTLWHDVLNLQADGVGLRRTDPDRQHALAVLVTKDDDGIVRDRVEDEAFDGHFDLHDAPSGWAGPKACATEDLFDLPDLTDLLDLADLCFSPQAVRARATDCD